MGADDFHVSVELGHPKTNSCVDCKHFHPSDYAWECALRRVPSAYPVCYEDLCGDFEEEDQVMFLVLREFEEEGVWYDEEVVLGKFDNYFDALASIREKHLSEQALCRIVEVRRILGPRIEFEKEKQWDS